MTPASGASAWWRRRVWSPGRWSRECRPSRASAGAEDRPRRRKEALLLPDGVLRLRGPREVDDRELALHLDDRAVAGLPLVRAQLRAGVRVDERLAHLDTLTRSPTLIPASAPRLIQALVPSTLMILPSTPPAGVAAVEILARYSPDASFSTTALAVFWIVSLAIPHSVSRLRLAPLSDPPPVLTAPSAEIDTTRSAVVVSMKRRLIVADEFTM